MLITHDSSPRGDPSQGKYIAAIFYCNHYLLSVTQILAMWVHHLMLIVREFLHHKISLVLLKWLIWWVGFNLYDHNYCWNLSQDPPSNLGIPIAFAAAGFSLFFPFFQTDFHFQYHTNLGPQSQTVKALVYELTKVRVVTPERSDISTSETSVVLFQVPDTWFQFFTDVSSYRGFISNPECLLMSLPIGICSYPLLCYLFQVHSSHHPDSVLLHLHEQEEEQCWYGAN
jgi:hypothetical protein